MATPLATAFVLIRPDTSKFGPELKKGVETGGAAAAKTADKHGRAFGTTYVKAAAGPFRSAAGIFSKSLGGVLAGFGAIQGLRVFGGFISDARESQKIAKLTAQVIKTTGGAAKITADQVGGLATALSNKTGVDDATIQSGENLLLTFTNLRNEAGKGNDIFTQATGIMTDMSVALGQDTKSSAIQLGKALNDPINGVTALQRVGVSFTAKQKEQIKALVESGDTLGAQKVILRELGKEFGGAAAAASSPMDKLRVTLGNVGEQLGGYLLPFIDKAATWLGEKLPIAIGALVGAFQEGDITSDGFIGILERIGVAARVTFDFISTQVVPRLVTFGEWLGKNTGLIKGIALALTGLLVVTKLHTAAMAVQAAGGMVAFLTNYLKGIKLVQVATKAWAAVQWLINAAMSANPIGLIIIGVTALIAVIVLLWKKNETFRRVVTAAWEWIKKAWTALVDGIRRGVETVGKNWALLIKRIDQVKQWFGDLGDAIGRFWQAVKDKFREGIRLVVMSFLDMVGDLVHGAATMFGWMPGIGPKLKTAAKAFDKFKDDVNRSLSGLKDRTVKVTAAFDARGKAKPGVITGYYNGVRLGARGGKVEGGRPGKDSVPYLLMPNEFIVRRDGSNLPEALAFHGIQGMAAGGVVTRLRVPASRTVTSRTNTTWDRWLGSALTRDVAAAARGLASMFGAGGIGSGVQRWAGLVLRVLGMLHQSSGWLGVVLSRMQRESGGNPSAINLWDINARRGTPSQGLMQTIPATFYAYAGPFRSRGIYDPLANIYAGLNYALHRYGSLAALSRAGGYDSGGWLPTGVTLAVNNTGRPERVLSPAQSKALDQGGRTYIINQNLTAGVHPAEVGRQTVLAIQAFERGNGSRWRQ